MQAICIAFWGVAHSCKTHIQGKELILSPLERSAEIFFFGERTNNLKRYLEQTVIQVGDAFSIVVEQGPKFIIELDESTEEVKEQREKEASQSLVQVVLD